MRTWFSRLRHYSNAGMLKSVMPRFHKVQLHNNKGYNMTLRNVNSKVKRANNYMFCGLMVHIEPIGGYGQFYYARDSTDIPHIEFKMDWSFEEWNTSFEQASI